MKKVIIASNNADKITEMKAILSSYFDQVLSMEQAEISVQVDETGATFEENAAIKARAVCGISGCPVISDDSGLEVDALDGAPGVFSARYAGKHGDDHANNLKLLRELSDVAPDKRSARYVCAVCLCFPDGRIISARGECEGQIRDYPAGEGGFGYDPYFYLADKGLTMAQLDPEVKNTLSHRYRALKSLMAMLGKN